MTMRLLLAPALAATATAAQADAGGNLDSATLGGMFMLATLAVTMLRVGLRQWRREVGRPEPVRMRVRARRYTQP